MIEYILRALGKLAMVSSSGRLPIQLKLIDLPDRYPLDSRTVPDQETITRPEFAIL